MASKQKPTEKTVVKVLSLGGVTGGGDPCAVDVKDGKIIRVRPLHFDSKYAREEIRPWKMQRNGYVLEASMKSMPGAFSLAYSKRALSPNRILYPLKRVDWDPNGERNTQNRGKSKYVRISWDEASTIIASEIKRIQKKYGPYAILAQADGHGECKMVHAPHGCQLLLLDKIGDCTQQVRNPDSWEGWYWGSKHVWGEGYVGMMAPSMNVVKDVSEYSDMVLFWGCDPETTPMGFTGQFSSVMCYFWAAAGIKQVYVCPDLNYGAAVHADKWIPVLPNTDAALQLAIIYTWITEGTFDKEYVRNHTTGMDKVADYVLGKEDGIPKTPAWASPKCGVPEWTIKALARESAVKTTSIAHVYGGGFIRGAFSHEPARLESIILGMQGLGKPGVHQVRIGAGLPRDTLPTNAQYSISKGVTDSMSWKNDRVQRPHLGTPRAFSKQQIPKTLIHDAILNPPLTFWGNGAIASPAEDQFVKYTYPIPKEDGGTEIHMIWSDTPCLETCWNEGHRITTAYKSPKIECIVIQHPWLENECLMADIILPSNTTFEVDDINLNSRPGIPVGNITYQEKAIEPVGESRSDYEVVLEVAKKLGKYEAVTEGKSVKDWIKHVYDCTGLPGRISWEDLQKNGYYVFATAPDWEKDPPGLRKFYENPIDNPLPTPSGKLEFYSERLAKNFPDDKERPPVPHWIEKSDSHDERLSSERAKKYPLLQMSNHGRWRVHAQCDDIPWTREAPTCKVKARDGYLYEPVWINPRDASKKNIKSGDIVKIFNERGIVLGGAYVTERIMPGVVSMDHGARVDWIIPGRLDRGGAINLISPAGICSKNCIGMATSGYLVEVERLSPAQYEEWKKQYPEAFSRPYDPASGLRFNAWVEGGIK